MEGDVAVDAPVGADGGRCVRTRPPWAGTGACPYIGDTTVAKMLILAILSASLAQAAFADDWPMEGKNPLHRAISQEQLAPPLKLAWTFAAGDAITASPVVSDGIVYAGSYDSKFYAINAETGKELWSFKLDTEMIFWAPAAVGGGVCVVGGGDGFIYARSAKTGQPIWQVRTEGMISGGGTIVGDAVYVGSWDHHVLALDLQTGKERWRFFANWYVQTAPAVDAERNVLFTNAHDHMGYALNTRDGSLIWKQRVSMQVGYPNNGPPCVDGERVFMAVHPGHFRCFEAASGKPLWHAETGANVSGCTVADGKVLAGTNAGLTAFNPENGQPAWQFRENAPVSRCSPAVSGGVVYFCSRNGKVYALNLADGAKLWEYATGGPIDGSPAIAGGALFVASCDGKVYCFRP
ncbi:MAG TPA: PQQ-binding-like beta-propeller repeat protein [Planctomycetota bacterium]|nr:PQQ-binding-like beta-propeller repeat protein [Planctomycetota bacterium]